MPASALASAPGSLRRGGRASWRLRGSAASGKGQRHSLVVPEPIPSLSPRPSEPLSFPPPQAVKEADAVHTHLAMDGRLGHPLAKLLEGVHRLQGGVGPDWEPLADYLVMLEVPGPLPELWVMWAQRRLAAACTRVS